MHTYAQDVGRSSYGVERKLTCICQIVSGGTLNPHDANMIAFIAVMQTCLDQ